MKKVFFVLSILLLVPKFTYGATGCAYPSAHDAFADRVAGDFLTVALLNQILCGIEKLESGPIKPTDGTQGAPSYSWRDDGDTGIYRSGANEFILVTGNVPRMTVNATGVMVGDSGTARGTLNSRTTTSRGNSFWHHNSAVIAASASINLEHATNGAGASDGLLSVFVAEGGGKSCLFVAGGGANQTAVIAGSSGICQITDTGSGTIVLVPDGDGTYTLKSRLSTDQTFHFTWLGG